MRKFVVSLGVLAGLLAVTFTVLRTPDSDAAAIDEFLNAVLAEARGAA